MREWDMVDVYERVSGVLTIASVEVRRTRDWQGYVNGHDVEFRSLYIEGKGWEFCSLMMERERVSLSLRYGRDAIRRFEERNRKLAKIGTGFPPNR